MPYHAAAPVRRPCHTGAGNSVSFGNVPAPRPAPRKAENLPLLLPQKLAHAGDNRRGVEAVCRCYGTEADKEMTHVCNTRVTVPQSAQMNRDQLAFFRRHIQPAAGGKNAPA